MLLHAILWFQFTDAHKITPKLLLSQSCSFSDIIVLILVSSWLILHTIVCVLTKFCMSSLKCSQMPFKRLRMCYYSKTRVIHFKGNIKSYVVSHSMAQNLNCWINGRWQLQKRSSSYCVPHCLAETITNKTINSV